MLDANIATTIFPDALVKISSNASITSISDPVNPFRSTFGTVRQKDEDARGSELGEPVEVEQLPVERGLIDLVITGMDDDAARRRDRERHTVGHAVCDAKELDAETSDGDAVARLHDVQLLLHVVRRVLELRFDERHREGGAVHRSLHIRQHVRNRADVILVTVGQYERGDPVLLELPQIRDDQIDAEEFRLREHDAGVDKHRRLAARDEQHVHAEFSEPAERDQFERRNVRRQWFVSSHRLQSVTRKVVC